MERTRPRSERGDEALSSTLSRCFPPFVAHAGTAVGGERRAGVHRDERALAERLGPRRREAFLAGRCCAHEALRGLGTEDAPVLPGPSGAPLWPAHVVGSITHTDEVAAAVVARARDVAGLGLDMEPLEPPLDPATVRLVLSRDERDELAGAQPKIAFCAKEAVYKALHPSTGRPLEFADVRVAVDVGRRHLRAVVAGLDRPLDGRYGITGGHIVVGVWLR